MSDQEAAPPPPPTVATVPLQLMVCMRCGTPFALAAWLYSRCLHAGAKFYCPNGHANQYLPAPQQVELQGALAELQRTRQEVAALKGRLVEVTARAEHLEATAAAAVPGSPVLAAAGLAGTMPAAAPVPCTAPTCPPAQ